MDSTILTLLNIKSVSLVGVLLAAIAYLIVDRGKILKSHEREKNSLKKELADSHTKLEKEYKESSEEIKVIIQKYYTLSSQFLNKIDIIINNTSR